MIYSNIINAASFLSYEYESRGSEEVGGDIIINSWRRQSFESMSKLLYLLHPIVCEMTSNNRPRHLSKCKDSDCDAQLNVSFYSPVDNCRQTVAIEKIPDENEVVFP